MRRMSQMHTPRKRHGPARHAHGYTRATDRPAADNRARELPIPLRTPPGTPLLMLVVVGFLCSVGIARVHTRTRVLEIGAEISELTSQQAGLLDNRRRLEAERAYLRHPDQVRQAASDRLGMIPLAPDRVRTIKLKR